MTTRKRLGYFYIAALIILVIITIIFRGNLLKGILSLYFWIVPAIFIFLGWLIGVIIYELKLRPIEKKNRIFFITHSIGLVLFSAVLGMMMYDAYHDNSNKNMRHNRGVMRNFVYDNEEYIRIAFNRLENEFQNPNDFNIDAFSVRKRDTLLNNSIQDTLYTIYFAYFLKDNKKDKYFSKVTVLEGKTTLHQHNENVYSSSEYLQIMTERKANERDAIQSIKETFQNMPESTRKMIYDTLRKAFNE